MISVVIPVYNGEKHIKRCLQSLIRQSYHDLEIIVIDDGSTDKTCDVCSEFVQTDSRIRLFQQKNAGVSVARNKGLNEATGEYITFVDADDFLPPLALEALSKGTGSCADLVIGGYEERRFGKSKRIAIQSDERIDNIKSSFEELDRFLWRPWGKLFRRSIINEHGIRFAEKVPFAEDTIFNLNYCKHAQRVQMVSDTVYCYNVGGLASSVRYYPDMHMLYMNLLKAHLDFFGGREKIPKQLFKRTVADKFLGSVMYFIAHCSYDMAVAKTEETFLIFGPYLDEGTVDYVHFLPSNAQYVLSKDARGLVKSLGRAHWLRILFRKIKYWLYAKKLIRK